MSTSVGVLTLTLISARVLTCLKPVHVLLVILHRIHAVEWEGAEERGALYRLALFCHEARVFLLPSRCPPSPGLAPWAYLISTDAGALMVASRTPNNPVATCVMSRTAYGASSSG